MDNSNNNGLCKDTSYALQPPGTYSFALNAVDTSFEGNKNELSTENSNEIYAQLPSKFLILGSLYIGDGETVLFLGDKENKVSEIGILSDYNINTSENYKTWINDENSPEKGKLHFSNLHPIDSVYRVRRGCEKIIYFTDGKNPPRFINLNNKKDFLDEDGNLDSFKMNIISKFTKIPELVKIEVLDGEGTLESGSYTSFIQYLDSDLNPSEIILETFATNIYKSDIESKYENITGSINLENYEDYFGNSYTTKAIKYIFDNLESKYPYYRVITAVYNSGTGRPSRIIASNPQSTDLKTFILSSSFPANAVEISETDIIFSDNKDIISSAKHIVQKDDHLLLGHLKGEQANLCKLQKYASCIGIDCYVKEVKLKDVKDELNPKNPILGLNGGFYMPEEIYSFGIMYLFEDMTTSPVFHIPGKNPKEKDTLCSLGGGPNLYPMDCIYDDHDDPGYNNENAQLTYIARDDNTYWGKDFYGEDLLDKKVRHHRFPSRKDIDKDLITYQEVKGEGEMIPTMALEIQRNITDSYELTSSIFEDSYYWATIKYYFEDNSSITVFKDINQNISIDEDHLFFLEAIKIEVGVAYGHSLDKVYVKTLLTLDGQENILSFGNFTSEKIYRQHVETTVGDVWCSVLEDSYPTFSHTLMHSYTFIGEQENIPDYPYLYSKEEYIEEHGLDLGEDCTIKYNEAPPLSFKYITEEIVIKVFTSEVYSEDITVKREFITGYGINLTNVIMPSEEDIGKKVIGYYIMNQKREDKEKTILSSGIITPTIPHKNYRNINWFLPQRPPEDTVIYEDWWSIKDQYDNNKNPFGTKYATDCFGITTIEYMYKNKPPLDFTTIEQKGLYNVIGSDIISGYVQTDAFGEIFSAEKLSKETEDDDKMSVRHLSTFSKVKYEKDLPTFNLKDFYVENSDKTVLYTLQPLTYGEHETDKYIYNMSWSDKRLGLYIELPTDPTERNQLVWDRNYHFYKFQRHLPYVYIKKHSSEYYTNYLLEPYYKINEKPEYFLNREVTLFGGDTYIVPHALTTHSYAGTVVGHRETESNVWLYILGAVVAVIAAVLTIWLGPVGVGVGYVAVGLFALAAGLVIQGISEYVTIEKVNELIEKHWKDKMEVAISDWYHMRYFIAPDYNANEVTPQSVREYQDDSSFTRGEVVDTVYFETDINTALAVYSKTSIGETPLKPFQKKGFPNGYWITAWKGLVDVGAWVVQDRQIPPQNHIDNYFFNKTFEASSSLKPKFRGFSIPTLYTTNADYNIPHKIKTYYHLPLEYDCKSKCREYFPNRWFWSNKAFDEELTDNYRIFKPNNYRDLDGSTGDITNMFVWNNTLYINTEEAFYMQPNTYQERVTDNIVTYIGTGEQYALPAKKIVDSENTYGAGTTLKQSFLETPFGVFFASDKDNKIYKFDGKLAPISDNKMSKWFSKNLSFDLNTIFKSRTKEKYFAIDKVFNHFGIGLISVYDKEFERILFTKKDYLFSKEKIEELNPEDKIIYNGKNFLIFRNYENIIQNHEVQNWVYRGIKNFKMFFTKYLEDNIFEMEEKYIMGEFFYTPDALINTGWTTSYSLYNNSWTSFHSYIPNNYISLGKSFCSYYLFPPEDSLIQLTSPIHKHNIPHKYQRFYESFKPFIIEFVSNDNPGETKIYEYISYITKALKWDEETEEYLEKRFKTFNKGLFYNSRQSTGILNLIVKDIEHEDENYLLNQVKDLEGDTIILDRNESTWSLNELRDYRIDYNKTLFITNPYNEKMQREYFIDKIVNEDSISYDKDWIQLEMLRDKYLVIRLIFDNFDDTKLVFSTAVEEQLKSLR